MKLDRTKKIIILFSAVIVVLLGLHYVVFSFIRKSDMSVSGLEHEVRALQVQVLEFSKYTPEDVKNLARSVTDRFISRTNIVSFIENLEKKAQAEGVTVTIRSVNVEPRSDDAADDKEIIRLVFETRGSWSDTMNFLAFVEHLPYKVTLHGLGLMAEPEDGVAGPVQWRGQFEITTLKFK